MVADVAKVGAIEGQIDVFGEAADRAERLGKRRAALEDQDGSVLSLQAEKPLQGPADPEVLFDDRVDDPSTCAGLAKKSRPTGAWKKRQLHTHNHPTPPWRS